MFCMGDFNAFMYPHVKSNDNVNYARMSTFHSSIKKCGLFDLGYNGPSYTWTNKRFSSKLVFERIDRCLANAYWTCLFPNANVYNLPIILSDHALVLTTLYSKYKKPKAYFKFEN
ncbi:hypothetical protein BRADI_2g42313v3, partial [Brachypodium distachyon]